MLKPKQVLQPLGLLGLGYYHLLVGSRERLAQHFLVVVSYDLPLLALGLDIPPALLQIAAVGSIGAAYGVTQVVPDDTIAQVAVQTLAVALLGVAAPAASLVGATVLGKLRSL